MHYFILMLQHTISSNMEISENALKIWLTSHCRLYIDTLSKVKTKAIINNDYEVYGISLYVR